MAKGCVKIAAAILDGKSLWVCGSIEDANQLLTDEDRQIPVFTLAEVEHMALAPKEAWQVAYNTKEVMPGASVVSEGEIKSARARTPRPTGEKDSAGKDTQQQNQMPLMNS